VFTFQPKVGEQSKKMAQKRRDGAVFSKEWEVQQKRMQFIKEAELNNRKAALDREELKECTFKPTVCDKSTKIIYDIPEVHLREKDFIDCFISGESSTRHRVSPTVGVG
jgi:hypothetical protein